MPAHAARLSPGRQCPHKAGAWPGHRTTAGIPHSSQEAPEESFSSGSFALEILLYLEFSSVPREPLLSILRCESQPHLQKLKDLRICCSGQQLKATTRFAPPRPLWRGCVTGLEAAHCSRSPRRNLAPGRSVRRGWENWMEKLDGASLAGHSGECVLLLISF